MALIEKLLLAIADAWNSQRREQVYELLTMRRDSQRAIAVMLMAIMDGIKKAAE